MNKLKLLKLDQDKEVRWTYENGPLSIIIGTGNINGRGRLIPNYWRLCEPNGRGLFSVDVEKESGRLLTMELTLYRDKLHSYKKENDEDIKKEVGVPEFDLTLWQGVPIMANKDDKGLSMFPNDRPSLVNLWNEPDGPFLYNIPASFMLQIGDGELRIELFPEKIMHHVTVGQKLVCEFNASDELCAITLKGLDADCQAHIKKQYGK